LRQTALVSREGSLADVHRHVLGPKLRRRRRALGIDDNNVDDCEQGNVDDGDVTSVTPMTVLWTTPTTARWAMSMTVLRATLARTMTRPTGSAATPRACPEADPLQEGLGRDARPFSLSDSTQQDEDEIGLRHAVNVEDGLHVLAAMAPMSAVEQDASVMSADPGGLEQVYREHAPRLWRALVAYSGDREIADDSLAEAFAQAVGRGDALRVPERWVWVAAFRIAAGELKARRLRAPVGQTPPPVEASEAVELLEALTRLPPKQRAVLVLHYYGGYKSREIALIVGSTAATVRVHLSAGRRRLRALLEVDDD